MFTPFYRDPGETRRASTSTRATHYSRSPRSPRSPRSRARAQKHRSGSSSSIHINPLPAQSGSCVPRAKRDKRHALGSKAQLSFLGFRHETRRNGLTAGPFPVPSGPGFRLNLRITFMALLLAVIHPKHESVIITYEWSFRVSSLMIRVSTGPPTRKVRSAIH